MRVPPVAYEEVYEFHLTRWEKELSGERRSVLIRDWKAISKDIRALQKNFSFLLKSSTKSQGRRLRNIRETLGSVRVYLNLPSVACYSGTTSTKATRRTLHFPQIIDLSKLRTTEIINL